MNKPSSKAKQKAKKPHKLPKTKESASAKAFRELKGIVHMSTPSLTFLAQAIGQGAKVFLTADPVILQHLTAIEAKFNIFLTDNYTEATSIAKHGRRRSALEMTSDGEHGRASDIS